MFSQEGLRPGAGFDPVNFAGAFFADEADAGGDAADEQGGGGGGGSLEDAARREREYVRERLRNELGREPTEEELSEWLRRHTEGY
jgi:hypothetical protein